MFFENFKCGCGCPVKPSCKAYGTMYNVGDTEITVATPNTYVPVTLNTQGPASSTTALTNSIQVNRAGTYAVYYRLNINASAEAAQTISAAVFNNGSIIAPTTASVALTEVTEGTYAGSLSVETIVELNACDVISLQLTSDTAGTITVTDYATLSVKQI